MKKITFLFTMIILSITIGQSNSIDDHQKEYLKDGWYKGARNCISRNSLSTNTAKENVWVFIENNKVAYIGNSKTKRRSNNLIVKSSLTKIPFARFKNGKWIADYTLSTSDMTDTCVDLNDIHGSTTYQARDINCSIEIYN